VLKQSVDFVLICTQTQIANRKYFELPLQLLKQPSIKELRPSPRDRRSRVGILQGKNELSGWARESGFVITLKQQAQIRRRLL
jgi:hypothetical protein